jgi:hypothetical protein
VAVHAALARRPAHRAAGPRHADYGLNAPFFADSGYRPSKNTLMVDFSPERVLAAAPAARRDRAREGITDNQLFLSTR